MEGHIFDLRSGRKHKAAQQDTTRAFMEKSLLISDFENMRFVNFFQASEWKCKLLENFYNTKFQRLITSPENVSKMSQKSFRCS